MAKCTESQHTSLCKLPLTENMFQVSAQHKIIPVETIETKSQYLKHHLQLLRSKATDMVHELSCNYESIMRNRAQWP